jgi:hypothetical protein
MALDYLDVYRSLMVPDQHRLERAAGGVPAL